MKILNHSRQTFLAQDARQADRFISRLTGLLNRTHLNPNEALIITRCQQIHMFFMRFAIDVVFIDRDNKVVGLVEQIKPFAMSRIYWQANRAIELPTGTIATTKTQLGDLLQIFN